MSYSIQNHIIFFVIICIILAAQMDIFISLILLTLIASLNLLNKSSKLYAPAFIIPMLFISLLSSMQIIFYNTNLNFLFFTMNPFKTLVFSIFTILYVLIAIYVSSLNEAHFSFKNNIAIIYTIIGFLLSINYIIYTITSPSEQILTPFKNPSHTGIFLFMCVMMNILIIYYKKNKIVSFLFFLVTSFGIILSGSRIVIFILLGFYTFLYYLYFHNFFKFFSLESKILIILVLIITILVAFSYSDRFYLKIKKILTGGLARESRFYLYKDCFTIIQAKPISGFGANCFKEAYIFTANKLYSHSYFKPVAHHAHNEFFELLISYGIFSIPIIFLFIKKSKFKKKYFNKYFFFAIVAVLIHSLFEFPLHVPAVGLTVTIFATLCSKKNIELNFKKINLLFKVSLIIFLIVCVKLAFFEFAYRSNILPLSFCLRLAMSNPNIWEKYINTLLSMDKPEAFRYALKFKKHFPYLIDAHETLLTCLLRTKKLNIFAYKKDLIDSANFLSSHKNPFLKIKAGLIYIKLKKIKFALSEFKKALNQNLRFKIKKQLIKLTVEILNRCNLTFKLLEILPLEENILIFASKILTDLSSTFIAEKILYKGYISKKQPLFLIKLIALYIKMKKYHKGIKIANRLFKLRKPLPDEFYYLTSILYYKVRENEKFEKSLKRFIRVSENFAYFKRLAEVVGLNYKNKKLLLKFYKKAYTLKKKYNLKIKIEKLNLESNL